MWETFDWKTESRGQSRRKEAEGASPHQSLFIPPEESLSAWWGQRRLNAGPRANSHSRLIPERANTFHSFRANWPKKDTVTRGRRAWEGLEWLSLKHRRPLGHLAYLSLLLLPFSHGYTTVYQSILSLIKMTKKQLCIFHTWALYAMNCT